VEHPVVVIGDSIPYNSPDDCPGCAGFAETYALALSEEGDGTYFVDNRSRHDGAQAADILEQVESGSLDDVLAGAAIVVVSAGFNDQPPYSREDGACSVGDLSTDEATFAAIIATTPDCIGTQTDLTRAELRGVLQRVRELAPEASIMALTAYDGWTGWPTLDQAGPETAAAVSQVITASLEAWRTAVCDEAAAVDGVCVDLLAAFNGPDGKTPSGDLLADDYAHPSQAGNDRIRDALLAG
jgi:lysophospholipase L1-like esterase